MSTAGDTHKRPLPLLAPLEQPSAASDFYGANLPAFTYGFPRPRWPTLQRFILESLVDDEFITVEIDADGCGRLKFDLPLDVTEAEIEYIRSLVPRAESGTLELLDPNTGEVVFACTPLLVH